MADPSVHVFDGKLYIYPSHDWESGIPDDDFGAEYDMKDYHVLSLEGNDPMTSPFKDNGVALKREDIAWHGRQLWDCDVARKDGKYYLYFPMKDKNDVFHFGVAVSDNPCGPFIPQPDPMRGSYSIDVCVYEENGEYYFYFGGIWDVVILDENGQPLLAGDNERRFFEASWLHKYNGKYYFSYSTGDTHCICYAIGDNPYGPFTYKGKILTPVVGWTTHHSIVEFEGKWWLFHHDSVPSKGVNCLRSLKVCELKYNEDGTIQTIDGIDE